METKSIHRNGTHIDPHPWRVLGTDTDRRFLETIREGIMGSDHLAFSFRGQYLLNTIASKYADPKPESALLRRTAAVRKLLATEERNAETVFRLQHTRKYSNVIQMAGQFIGKILGDCDVKELFSESDFSGGASISRSRDCSIPEQKFDPQSAVTYGALPFYYNYLKHHPTNFVGPVQVVGGNDLFTVPKNSDIDRCACKEPDWNMFFQKGLGTMIRKRLKRVGIDLNDQSKNRYLASIAHAANLCTIDLSAASDSITEELVYQLLPSDWFYAIDRLRSPIGNIDQKVIKWRLISTMGNGFTFELESLIFFALVKAVVTINAIQGPVSVYGDDIICPRDAYDLVKGVFSYCGFILNDDKSFKEGAFFESCGGHYYNGSDVTPFYLRNPLVDESGHPDLEGMINFVNQFRRWATGSMHNEPGTHIADPALYDTWKKLVSLLPKCLSDNMGQDHESSTVCIYSYGVTPKKRLKRVYSRKRRIDGILSYWYFFLSLIHI